MIPVTDIVVGEIYARDDDPELTLRVDSLERQADGYWTWSLTWIAVPRRWLTGDVAPGITREHQTFPHDDWQWIFHPTGPYVIDENDDISMLLQGG